MNTKEAVNLALDGLEEGYRVIASKLNTILGKRCESLKIKIGSKSMPKIDSFHAACQKIKFAWHYLGNRVQPWETIYPWTLGLNYKGGTLYLVRNSDYEQELP